MGGFLFSFKKNWIRLAIFSFAVFLLSPFSVFSAVAFLSPMKLGDEGPAVLALQKFLNSYPDTRVSENGIGSPGFESDYFGARTRNAVIRFQEKHSKDILIPAGLSIGTGYVGPMTLAKLNALSGAVSTLPVNETKITHPALSLPAKMSTEVEKKIQTRVFSVFPESVKKGDLITITGENFSFSNNTVILGDGLIERGFEGLASRDGRTISFVYQPPKVVGMSEEEIRSLPKESLAQIEEPIKKAGKEIADVLNPYDGMNNESELKSYLEKNGRSFDDMYHQFFVVVKNQNGTGVSEKSVLKGLRELPFDRIAISESISKTLSAVFEKLFPVAYAQGLYGGGFKAGIVMICTCGDGYLTFMTSLTGGGSGLYHFSWGFMPNAGSGMVPGTWLGGYMPMAGVCSIYAGITCINIMANSPQKPWGSSL